MARYAVRWLGTCLLALSTFIIIVGWPGPAHGHTDLVSSSPADGAEGIPLDLERIQLVFSDDVFPVGNDVVVQGPDGAESTSGEPAVMGSRVEAGLRLTTPGRHTVSYRVVGQDGHVISGELTFTAVADKTPLASATAAPQPGMPHATATPDIQVSTDGGAPGSRTGTTSLTWLLAPALALIGILVVARRRSSTRDAPGKASSRFGRARQNS